MQSLLEELLRAWSPAGPHGPRLEFVWQAHYTESGGVAARVVAGWPAAGVRMAGAVHRVEELLRTWSPPGPRLAFVWQAQYTEPSGGAAARTVACWLVGYVNVPWGSRDKGRCENWCLASS